MNYSDKTQSCRVDFFKPSGKWYTTEAVDFIGDYEKDHPCEGLRKSLQAKGRLLKGMIAVCLEPYVKHQFPALIYIDNEGNVSRVGCYGIRE